jgi:SAM-dependent methyltransferase
MNHFFLLELCYSMRSMTEQRYLPLLIESWKGSSRLEKEELFRIAHGVRQISRGLTGSRELAGEPYLDDPVALGAYLCYYWPVSYRAASFLLSTVPVSWGKIDSALDIGCGAGPVTFALIDQGIQKVVACDRSEKALKVVRQIARRRNVSIQTRLIDLERGLPLGQGLPPGPFHLITLGNLLNELWKNEPDRIERRFQFVKSLGSFLAPDGRIVIFEPALSSTSRELLQVRDLATSDGVLYVEAPCFRQAHCPALPEGVCHTEIPWNPPPPGAGNRTKGTGIRSEVGENFLSDPQARPFPPLLSRLHLHQGTARRDFPTGLSPIPLSPRAAGCGTLCAGKWAGFPFPLTGLRWCFLRSCLRTGIPLACFSPSDGGMWWCSRMWKRGRRVTAYRPKVFSGS